MYSNVFITELSSARQKRDVWNQVELLRVARQSLLCYTAVARLSFKRRATAVLRSNLVSAQQ